MSKTKEGVDVKVGQLWEGGSGLRYTVVDLEGAVVVLRPVLDSERVTRMHTDNLPHWWKLIQDEP